QAGWRTSLPDGVRAYQTPLLPDDDAGLVGHALVEVDHVLVHQPNTAGRDRLADGIPFRRGVQPVERVLAALEDVERARAERIVEAGRLAAVFGRIFGKPRLAGDHLGRRRPFRPFLPPLDGARALPGKTLAAYADAIAHGAAARFDQIAEARGRIDDDGAGSFTGRIDDPLAVIAWIDLPVGHGRNDVAAVHHAAIHGIELRRAT